MVAYLCRFYKYFHGYCFDKFFFPLVPGQCEFKRATRLAFRFHPVKVELVTYNRHYSLSIILFNRLRTSGISALVWVKW